MRTILEVTPTGDTLHTMSDAAYSTITQALRGQSAMGQRPYLHTAMGILRRIAPEQYSEIKSTPAPRSAGGGRVKADLDTALNLP